MLMYRLWWPTFNIMRKTHPNHTTTRWWPIIFFIHLVGFMLGAPFLWGCILDDRLQQRFCAKYLSTLLEERR